MYIKWTMIENPEIDPHKYAELNFNKGAKAIQWRKDNPSTNGTRAIGLPLVQNMNLDLNFTHYIKANSK